MTQNRAGSMAMWVAPIRVYHHNSRELDLFPLVCCDVFIRWFEPNRWWWYIRLHSRWVVGHCLTWFTCCVFLWTPVYLSLEIHWSGGSSLPGHSWNPFSNKRCTVLIVPNYAEREMQAFSYFNMYLWFRHYYNIIGFWYKSVLVIVREKPVRVYVRRGLTRYLWFKGVFEK